MCRACRPVGASSLTLIRDEPSVQDVRTLLPDASRKVLALATLLPLVVALSGVDTLCFCGGCERSDALLGVQGDADAAESAHEQSPCCKRAAAAASALAQAQHDDDAQRARPVAEGYDCCSDHGLVPAPADVRGDSNSVAFVAFVAIDANLDTGAPVWGCRHAWAQVRVAEARGPPRPSAPVFRSTSRIRV